VVTGEGLSNGVAGHEEFPFSEHKFACRFEVVIPHWHAVKVPLIVLPEVVPGVHVNSGSQPIFAPVLVKVRFDLQVLVVIGEAGVLEVIVKPVVQLGDVDVHVDVEKPFWAAYATISVGQEVFVTLLQLARPE
jgi:hypothetical protein